MAYTVNWTTRVIEIPSTDLVPVINNDYQLDMSSFHIEIRRLEWEFTEGLWAPQILDHTSPKTIAGTTYAPFDEIINGYTVTFDVSADRVDLVGSNNNIIDVLNYNGVSVVPGNSAGLIITTVGSGLTQEEHDKLFDNSTKSDVFNATQI